MSLAAADTVTFLGAPFDLVAPRDVIETIKARRPAQPFRYIVTPNVDHIVRLTRMPDLRRAYDGAWLSLCDSHPVRFLGRLLGHRLPHFTGADLTASMFEKVLEPGDAIAVIGANAELIGALRRQRPDLAITAHVPPMGFASDEAAFAEAVAFGARCGARFLFLAVGSPQSERVAEAIAATPGATGTALCIGASLEFLTGRKQRAPKLMRDLGIEWMHRFASEPRRLWRRYLLGALPLARLFVGELMARARAGAGERAGTTGARAAAVDAAVPRLRRPLVLHITGDHPDPLRASTTVAIKQLIDGAKDSDHIVFSLDRKANPLATYLKECPAPEGQRLFAYGHFGLPLGIGLYAWFWLAARRIGRILEAEGLKPDVVHAHRLTFDGIAGWLIARRLGIPLFLSVRGEVESKVFRFKPLYRPLLRRIVADAQRIYYVSAWYRPHLERTAGAEPAKSRTLPNAVRNARAAIETVEPEPAILTVANLDIWRKKGVHRLIEAFARVADELPGIRLDIVGTGNAASLEDVRGLIARSGQGERVRLLGQLPNCELVARMPAYLALALPSRNETFGMVYTEALFAGLPILYSRRTGIDGYLDGLDVGIAVDPRDAVEIAGALRTLVQENERFRAAVRDHAGELHRRFDPARQVALYQEEIAEAARRPKTRRWQVEVQVDWRPLETEWRRLETEGVSTPFQRYDWAAAWYARTVRHGRAEPVIVTVREAGGDLALILPLARYRAHGAATVGFADLRVTDYAAPVMRRGLALTRSEARALLRQITRRLPRADILHLSKLVREVRGEPNILLLARPGEAHEFMAHTIPLEPGRAGHAADRMRSGRSSELRRKLEAVGPVTFHAERGTVAARRIFTTLLSQRHARFAALGREDALADSLWQDLYRSLVEGSDARPLATMIALESQGELIATGLGIEEEGRYLLLAHSFARGRFDQASPGLQLILAGLEWAADRGHAAFDLTVGDEPYKRQFRPETRPLFETMQLLGPRGLVPWLTWRAKVGLRRHPRLRGRLRRLLGR